MKMIKKYCNRETVSYLIFGLVTTVISIAVFWICEATGFSVAISNTISTAAAVTFAYLSNKIFVFRSVLWTKKTVTKEVSVFIAGRFLTYVAETLLLVLLVYIWGFPGFICKIFTTGLVIACNYLISKKLVFNAEPVKTDKPRKPG